MTSRSNPLEQRQITISQLGNQLADSCISNDTYFEVLIHLALAHYLLQDEELKAQLDLIFKNVLYLRSRMPAENLDTTLLTRFGRLSDGSKDQSLPD